MGDREKLNRELRRLFGQLGDTPSPVLNHAPTHPATYPKPYVYKVNIYHRQVYFIPSSSIVQPSITKIKIRCRFDDHDIIIQIIIII